MHNALTYLTRACPRQCTYCRIRDTGAGPELDKHQWVQAFQILKNLGIDFNLILGNEAWLLGTDLLHVMEKNQVPYAMYSTCPSPLFENFRDMFLKSGKIDNLSCGVDYPLSYLERAHAEGFSNDMERKSYTAWMGLQWAVKNCPGIDTQGTMTVHRQNFMFLPDVVRELTANGSFCGVNFIHYSKDGQYDFFPPKEEIAELLFQPEDYPALRKVLDKVLEHPGNLQNPEFLALPCETLCEMGWHCKGDPYGGPTIDANGKLRLCGYRKGSRTSEFSIFDLEDLKALVAWEEAVRLDAEECPGCCWSYPWMFRYWSRTQSEFGKKVFVKHAGKHIEEKDWRNRNVE